ncbi:MAG: transcriptional repressor [FCB group bacterium]|nr:transcriptional repressor [FCB group bacterium]MBL7027679.1 transcriptional repressor [Candidatus Neomarinimicrobiota bacterium]MBL7121074.1 transcriptional repressor [Candidatus Neomarinimicrobiota bacterium]
MSAAENQQLKQVLREHELKATTQRIALLKLLDVTHEHFDAEEIYLELLKKQKNVSRATVYRSLEALAEQDLVTRLDFGDGRMRFERSKGEDEHHDHLICEECGKVIEFFNLEMEAQQLSVCEENDFTPSTHTMHIFGTCSDCKKTQ